SSSGAAAAALRRKPRRLRLVCEHVSRSLSAIPVLPHHPSCDRSWFSASIVPFCVDRVPVPNEHSPVPQPPPRTSTSTQRATKPSNTARGNTQSHDMTPSFRGARCFLLDRKSVG